jgi:uncharacterized protein (TIGR02453 family)
MSGTDKGKARVFTPETFRFFRELARNNDKAWMDANRERYRAHVVEPLHALLDRLTPAVLRLDEGFQTSGRTGENFSRINRDIRFAADKSPYRAQMYLLFANPLGEDWQGAQLYAGISADAVTAGFRIYGNTRSKNSALGQLGRPRALAHPQWIQSRKRRLGKRYESYWYSAERGEWTKHAGWPAKSEEWKKLQGWIVRRKLKPSAAVRGNFAAEIGKVFRDVFPLYKFTSSKRWKP